MPDVPVTLGRGTTEPSLQRVVFLFLLLLVALPVQAQNGLAKDWKKAIWRSPLHILLSAPVTVATIVVPPVGKKWIQWRTSAEASHVVEGKDTPQKATIDLYTQTALVRRVLKFYHIQVTIETNMEGLNGK